MNILLLSLPYFLSTSFSLDCFSDTKSFNAHYKTELQGKDIESLIDDYTNFHAEGGTSFIYRIPWIDQHNSQTKFAALKISKPNFSSALLNEKYVLDELNKNGAHFVPKLYACFAGKKKFYLLIEFLEKSLEPVSSGLGPLKPNLNPVYNKFRKLAVSNRLYIYSEILSAVGEIHSLGLVHHDLKPGNLMLARPASGGGLPKIRVVDFGTTRMEGCGFVGGTPAFMDLYKRSYFEYPLSEKIRAKIQARTDQKKADLWALAVSFYLLENFEEEGFGIFKASQPEKISSVIQEIRERILSPEWMKRRGLFVCSPDKSLVFSQLMEEMVQPREKMRLEAKELAEKFLQLGNNFVEMTPPADEKEQKRKNGKSILDWLFCPLKNKLFKKKKRLI